MTVASLMVRLLPGGANGAVLRLAADLALRLKVTQLIGIAACQPLMVCDGAEVYVAQAMFNRHVPAAWPTLPVPWKTFPPSLTASIMPSASMNARAQIDQELEACAKEFRSRLECRATTIEWRSTVTFDPLSDYIARELRAADLLITSTEEGGSLFDTTHRLGLADLVLKAGRPVLVAAEGTDKVDLSSVVVAWKETREARRAIEDALPLLQLADAVTVVEVAAAEELTEAGNRTKDVVDWLARHGIAASARAIRGTGNDSLQLSTTAAELGAGLIVGGAYGHARVREWILGGITREVLLRPAHCSLVSH
jgi:nucleotide-binding universal stress UspA family protein